MCAAKRERPPAQATPRAAGDQSMEGRSEQTLNARPFPARPAPHLSVGSSARCAALSVRQATFSCLISVTCGGGGVYIHD